MSGQSAVSNEEDRRIVASPTVHARAHAEYEPRGVERRPRGQAVVERVPADAERRGVRHSGGGGAARLATGRGAGAGRLAHALRPDAAEIDAAAVQGDGFARPFGARSRLNVAGRLCAFPCGRIAAAKPPPPKVEALAAAVAEVLAREAAAEGVAAALLRVRVVDVFAAVVALARVLVAEHLVRARNLELRGLLLRLVALDLVVASQVRLLDPRAVAVRGTPRTL